MKKNAPSRAELTTEQAVRQEFQDIPVLIEIARCESHFTQFNPDGSIKQGDIDPNDIGAFQISRTYHLKDAVKAGIDIYTLEGNMKFARRLYEDQGTRPWLKSSGCWKD